MTSVEASNVAGAQAPTFGEAFKTWFKIGDLDGFRLDEVPELEQANANYAKVENLASLLGITSVPGYFELSQEVSEPVLRPV